jgi:hypothetical protein
VTAERGEGPVVYMLCRNQVADFRRWKRVFTSHRRAHLRAGLRLAGLWRSAGRPGEIFYLFEVGNVRKAKAFITAPGAKKAGKEAGVIEGEYRFLRSVPAKVRGG